MIEFLRDVGKHFPVNKMLARDVVRNRLESGISFTEFSYQLLQANDFYQLHVRNGCALQFGGSDQWGNITAGVDFVRRRGAGPVHAFTTPLVLKADGTKFGKSEGGAVWLDPTMTSPYAFYQFWINADDRDVSQYLRYFSFKTREELEELEKATAERPQARLAQRALARGDHGAGARRGGGTPGGHGEPGTLRARLRWTSSPRTRCGPRWPRRVCIPYAVSSRPWAPCSRTTGLVASANEARRTIAEGGAYLNNERITDGEAVPPASALLHGRFLVLRRGKRTFAGVELLP